MTLFVSLWTLEPLSCCRLPGTLLCSPLEALILVGLNPLGAGGNISGNVSSGSVREDNFELHTSGLPLHGKAH